MKRAVIRLLPGFIFVFYLLYIISSTFSIAITQITLGLSLIGFLIFISIKPFNPFCGSLARFYQITALYIGWILLSALTGPTPVESAIAVKEEWLFLAIPIGVYLYNHDQYRRYLITAFAVSVAIVATYGIIQHFFGIDWYHTKSLKPAPNSGYLVRGNFPHPLTFGNFFAVASGFLITLGIVSKSGFDRRLRVLLVMGGIIAGGAVMFSYSRGSIIALLFGLLFLSFIQGRRYWVYGFGIIVIAVGVLIFSQGLSDRIERNIQRDLSTNDEMGRPFIWESSLHLVVENPVFGVGRGNFPAEYAKRLPPDVEPKKKHVHAHCDLINIAANEGIPAMLFYISFWLIALFSFWKGHRGPPGTHKCYLTAALIGSVVFFISSITEATFADEEVREMLMFVWAIGLGAWYKQYAQNIISNKTS
ncbi:MAG: hypothetical protein DRP47_01480 [Candidatus Zixiibacteriota bacterium]|nr:MAG: hypothetical protein DRP47_01480 [candidate division Zixibacteria bacterium]